MFPLAHAIMHQSTCPEQSLFIHPSIHPSIDRHVSIRPRDNARVDRSSTRRLPVLFLFLLLFACSDLESVVIDPVLALQRLDELGILRLLLSREGASFENADADAGPALLGRSRRGAVKLECHHLRERQRNAHIYTYVCIEIEVEIEIDA